MKGIQHGSRLYVRILPAFLFPDIVNLCYIVIDKHPWTHEMHCINATVILYLKKKAK